MEKNIHRRADIRCNRNDIEVKKESSILGSFFGIVKEGDKYNENLCCNQGDI